MEYVYKISGIDINNLVKCREELELPHVKHRKNPQYGSTNRLSRNILKDENANYLGFEWEDILLFVKNYNCVGIHHKDGEAHMGFCWAMNWVWGSDAIMEYWTDDQLTGTIHEKTSDGGSRHRSTTDQPPCKTYHMTPGVYIVNTAVTHRPATSGNSMRFTLSMRPINPKFSSWEEVVEYFSNKIIKQ
jgi:hypothetical protein